MSKLKEIGGQDKQSYQNELHVGNRNNREFVYVTSIDKVGRKRLMSKKKQYLFTLNPKKEKSKAKKYKK